MSGLRIRKVKYLGDRFYFESPYMGDGIVLIDGENEMGKSTFCDLIYFGLGGKVPEFDKTNKELVERHVIYDDTNNYVELEITINNEKFVLNRPFSQNKIIIIDSKSNLIETKIYRTSREQVSVFSDWILDKLNIDIFELYQGTRKSYIGITDLMRLIYHDQKTAPDNIYKIPDNDNFMTDSLEIRKAIFEVIVGKSFVDYYSLLGDFKNMKKESDGANASFKTFDSFIHQTYPNGIDNKETLERKIVLLKDLLYKLELDRKIVKSEKTDTSEIYTAIKNNESKIISLRAKLKFEVNSKNTEKLSAEKVVFLIESLEKEISEIENIQFFDSKLKLYSQNNCPYCLSEVNRTEGKCICGSEIDEEEYEKFFYTNDDYFEIIKSKKSNLNTLRYLLKNKNDLIKLKDNNIEGVSKDITILEQEISGFVLNLSSSYNEIGIKQIDERILKSRKDLDKAENLSLLSTKREILYRKSQQLKEELSKLDMKTQQAELQARHDILSKVQSFNKIYNSLMIKADSECYGASINEIFTPVINGGIHRARSALVAKRLMYYLTLLLMTKEHDVNHFHFMLVDTPKKEGIDSDKFLGVLSMLDVGKTEKLKDFQIILTTGEDAVPDNLKVYAVLHLGKKKILQQRIKTDAS